MVSVSNKNKNKNKYGFVVLNYKNHGDTINCVESILKIVSSDDYHVVIVDNSSPNDSYTILEAKYKDHPKVTLALSEKNGGYSSGNNIGIAKLLEFGIEKIVIATNDTEIISLNILEEFEKFNSSDIGIIGTNVLTPDGVQQNPPYYRPTFLYFLNLYLYLPMVWLRVVAYKTLPFLERYRRSAVKNQLEKLEADTVSASQCSVYMLHGCFLYLTKNYLEKVGMLDENLFMYGEEDLMSWNCELHGLKRLYLPCIKILHKDGQSTKETHQKDKEEFVLTMTRKSKKYLVKKIGTWEFIKFLLSDHGKR